MSAAADASAVAVLVLGAVGIVVVEMVTSHLVAADADERQL